MIPAPQRRVIMFADISGSAGLFERLGQAEAVYAIERCVNRMTRSIEGHGGVVAEAAGDELLATFETPTEACLAAIDMQQRTADLPAVSAHRLSIRIGIHAGLVNRVGNKLEGDAVTTAARIAGIAGSDQILASAMLMNELGEHPVITFIPEPGFRKVREGESVLGLCLVRHAQKESPHAAQQVQEATPSRLKIRYRNKIFIVDQTCQKLTFGRDLGCKVLVEDRKASRQHGRIELRPDGFFMVDTSTNGTFVSQDQRQEVMVRHHEVRLENRGWIAFGNSGNDPAADKAEFFLE